jgi:hypothetical protein
MSNQHTYGDNMVEIEITSADELTQKDTDIAQDMTSKILQEHGDILEGLAVIKMRKRLTFFFTYPEYPGTFNRVKFLYKDRVYEYTIDHLISVKHPDRLSIHVDYIGKK